MKLIPTTINPVSITLYRGIPFDNNYSEHTLLSNQFKFHGITGGADNPTNIGQDKENFINMKNNDNEYIYPRITKSGTFNFAFGNGLVTSVVMELTGDEINSNYMKVVSGNDVYYYFITGIIQKNEVTYLLNLELDVFMTYSEEFLTNIKDKPVMVERKHCRRLLTERILTPQITISSKINMACFKQETTFSHIKSNIIKSSSSLEYKDYIDKNNVDYNSVMRKLHWAYVIVGRGSEGTLDNVAYTENGVSYPYQVRCFPLVDKYKINVNNDVIDVDNISCLNHISSNPLVQKVIISPYAPFKYGKNLKFTEESDGLHLYIHNVSSYSSGFYLRFYSELNNTGTYFDTTVLSFWPTIGFFRIDNGYGGKIEYKTINNYFDTTSPSIYDTRDTGEYKLQISPFKSLRMSAYYGDEKEIFTQLMFGKIMGVGYEDNNKLKPYTITTSNAEINTYYNGVDIEQYELKGKRGNINAVSYNIPTGTSAEQIYNLTSRNQYENTRVVNAITGALSIGGGIASIALGGAMGKVAGVMAIAGGVAGEIKNITEHTSKMEDMKNTPNSYNFSGTSYPYDIAYSKSDNSYLLPYLITYGVDDITYDMGAEFLYHYGYDYNAESYFSTDLWTGTDNIFERRMFNYIKIREDISSKLVGTNLPIIVAKKMSDVLNAGIKFWTFLNFDLSQPQMSLEAINKYFQKSLYCNAELINVI